MRNDSLRIILLQLFCLVGIVTVAVQSSSTAAGDASKTCSATDGSCDNDNDGEGDKVDASAECVDEHEKCDFWANLVPSECDENPGYMLRACRKSCNLCNDKMIILPSIENDLEFDLGEKQKLAGERAYETRAVLEKTIEYVRTVVMVDPKFDKVRPHCKNRHQDCSFWALLGECEANPNYMQIQCAPSCQTCDQIAYETRCPMDNLPPEALQPGDLNKMFERITTAEEFKKYNPTILSQPSKEKEVNKKDEDEPVENPEENPEEKKKHSSWKDRLASMTKKAKSDENDGPWVVVLDDFVSPEECDQLVELGRVEGYERSADVGQIKFDGTFDSSVNDGRTSKNAWCNEDCYKDDMAKNVIERITNLTGVPEPNSEYLQLLKYEVGEYYRSHHDYIPHQMERQCGVRTLTVFLYLNDVAQGGGTNFPYLDLTVTPKKGRALVWPSVLDSDPNRKDSRTQHQALPVEKGTKYGANAWLHQRDFKTPNGNNCQ